MTYTHDELRDTAEALDRLMRDVVPMLRYAAEDREALAAKDAEITRLTDSESANGHERSLIDADTQRGITNCSTPLFQRLRNMRDELVKQDAEIARLAEDNDQLRRDRYEALSVYTKEGLLASEWVAKTGRAKADLAAVNAKVRELREALQADTDTDALTMMDLLGLTGEEPA